MSRFGDFEKFAEKVEKKAKKRKPVKTKVKVTGTLFAQRNKRIAIREAALRGVSLVVLYKKVTTGEVKRYEVLPISWRYRKTKAGMRKVIFLQDIRDKRQLKYFVLKNIVKAALTDRKAKPDWPVEIV